jgi:hypothetical protein
LRDEPWLVVDRFLPYEDQLELYRRALSGVILDDAAFKGLSPDLREALALPAFKGEDGRSGPAPDEGEKTSFGVESSALEAETGVATRRSVSDLIDSPASGRVAFAEAEETLGSGD